MATTFSPATSPFSRWSGPYSVARGTQKSGFRFHRGRLGAWVETSGALEFWTVVSSPGINILEQLVRRHWGSGRVLLLPDGYVAKPDPEQQKTCIRYLIGRIQGPIVVKQPNGKCFDLSQTQHLRSGDPWPGPGTTGIECKLDVNGRLECTWELAAPNGRLVQTLQVWGPDPILGAGLRAARPGMSSARVRVQVGGAITTMREDDDDVVWAPRYVGRIDVTRWPFDDRWVVS